MSITNDGQLTNLYNRRVILVKKKQVYNEIHKECYKPLQSKLWVEPHNIKSKWKDNYHDDMESKYKTMHFGNTWYEIDRPQWRMTESERKQWELYKKLKKEYNERLRKEREIVKSRVKSKVTIKDKVRTINGFKLMDGLAGHDYSKIYG